MHARVRSGLQLIERSTLEIMQGFIKVQYGARLIYRYVYMFMYTCIWLNFDSWMYMYMLYTVNLFNIQCIISGVPCPATQLHCQISEEPAEFWGGDCSDHQWSMSSICSYSFCSTEACAYARYIVHCSHTCMYMCIHVHVQIPQREGVDSVQVKISGDGARFSSSSSFLHLSFSLPGTSENVLSSAGTCVHV